MQIAGRRTRDIAIATESTLAAHAVQHNADVVDIRHLLTDSRTARERMHEENKAELASIKTEQKTEIIRVHERIDKVETGINKLPWKIIGWLGTVFTLVTGIAVTAIGFLLQRALFPH